MKLADFMSRADRIQQSRGFKIIASCVIVGVAIALFIAYSVAAAANKSGSIITPEIAAAAAEADGAAPGADGAPKGELDLTARIVNDILKAKQSTAGFGVGLTIAAGLSLVVIWLGLGLTYLGFAALGALLVGLCVWGKRGDDLGIAAAGLVGLFATFAALMQALRLLLGSTGPVWAVARNVLAEAVRMKVSIIFIVLVVFGLAALPLVLDPHQPLRYRVQSFLQFSTAGCFWLVAILVLAFSVSSVTFEQRDKIIWQTMTKPVAAWQYILGKWLGVSALAGALMLVCASGIFLFTEHLRNQPAMNETSSYVAQSGAGITEDRFILETQVLTARATVRPDPLELDEEQFQKNVEERVKAEMNNLAQTISDPEALRNKREELTRSIAYSLRKAVQADFRSIPPGRGRAYTFSGLEAARESNRPLVLRFKLEAGANRPDENYRVTIEFAGGGAQIEQIGLGQFHSIPVSPSYVDAKGVLTMQIINGDAVQRVANAEYLSFSNEGLEVSYATGGFRANFFRCIGILWIKLVFLAMLAIAASTFLSFPVACLVSFSIFLAAEGAGFIAGALENYSTEDRNGKMLLIPTLIAKIAGVVSGAFRVYADLRPTGRIVDGLALSWMDVAGGVIVLGGASAVLYVGAVYIFRRRELATYSGN